MRAKTRFCEVLAAAGLLLAPSAALAQSVPDATTNAPAGTVGPPELRNFSLPGTVTRPADQTAPPTVSNQASPTPNAPAPQRRTASSPAATSGPPVARVAERALGPQTQTPAPAPPTTKPLPPAVAPTFELSPAQAPPSIAAPQTEPIVAPQAISPPGHQFSLLPWLAAGLAILLGGGFLLFMRYRRRDAYAAPEFDLFVAPETASAPIPATPRPAPPAQPRAAAPVASPPAAAPFPATPRGIISTRLRPSLEIAVQPLRCHCDADKVVLEFELELINTGSVPARAVLAEASLLNAGATQDEQLSAFFANPVGQGESLDSIPPLKSMKFASQVVAPRSAVQEYELAGRKVFVPVLAFNALYRWGSGEGQTSAAYLVGRETRGDKLGPLRLDGPQADFRSLAARALPAMLRT